MSNVEYSRVIMGGRLRPGDRIDDKYVVRGVLGTGASATVYEAIHEEIDTAVAVKVVHAESSNEPHHLARFRREARTCGRIRSPHVPQVYDVGRLPDGSPYMVMERLHGETLEARVARGPLPLGLVFEVGAQLLRALEAVHGRRAIHRDVKPENLVLEHDHGRLTVKLVDFGISKNIDEPKHMTMEGMVLGTPHYMAPEQVEGGHLDERVDIYAAGAVLYEMITGRTPFQGTTADQVMAAVQRDPVMPPGIYRDECPFELEAVVMTAMSRNRDLRFRTAMLMRESLEEAERVWQRESRPTPLVVRKSEAPVEAPVVAPILDDPDSTLRIRAAAPPMAGALAIDEDDMPKRGGGGRWLLAAAAVVLVLGGMTAIAMLAPDDGATVRASRAPVVAPFETALTAGTARAQEEAHAMASTEEAPPTASDLEDAQLVAAEADDEPQTEEAPREARPSRAREAGAPSTTVMPARRDPREVQAELRQHVRETMLRDWPFHEDEIFGADPAKESESPAAPPSLPEVVRDNPYGQPEPAENPPPSPF